MLVRPPADHRVDGSDVEAPRGVELTDPKRPRGLPHTPRPTKRGWARDCWCSRPLCCSGHTDRKPRPRGLRRPVSETVPVAMAEGKHPVPYRTRKLSLPAPMVLHAGACGRVGDRRTTHHPRRGPGTPPRAPTPCGGTTIQQPHQHTRQRYTGTRQRTPGYDTKTHHHAVPAEGRRVLTDDEEPVFRRRAGPRRGWARVTPFRTGRVVRVRGHDPGTLRARTGMSAGHGR